MLSINYLSGSKKDFNLKALESSRYQLSYGTVTKLINYLEQQFAMVVPIVKKPCVLLFNNNIEYVITFLAVTRLCPVMPINPLLPVDQIQDVVQALSPVAVIHDTVNSDKAHHLAQKIGTKCYEINLDAVLKKSEAHINSQQTKVYSYPGESDVALILHTSGTTAKPKCIQLTYNNLQKSIENVIKTLALSSRDRNLNMMPLFHIHGIVASMLSTLTSGGTLILKEIDYTNFAQYLVDDKPTWYTAVPTIHHKIYQSLSTQPVNESARSLRFIRSCSSPLSEGLHQNLQTLLNIPVVQAYGMTEAAHQVSTNPLSIPDIKVNSVGKINGAVSVVIVGDDSQILANNEVGEVCIQGQNVFQGYLNNPQANKDSFIDDYFRTGDLGYIDTDGYLFLTGRKKEIINKGGFKISPLQIDQIILKHSQIKEAITFPIPHETLGDDIGLMIVAEKGLEEKDIYIYLQDKLADHMLPSRIYFVDEIPKSATGKINRLSIAKQLPESITTSRSPESQLEVELVELWKSILKIHQVQTGDNFFQLGGNSLLATEFYNEVLDRYQVQLQTIELYQSPTIAKIAVVIEINRKNMEGDWLNEIDLILKQYEHDKKVR